LNLNLTGHPPLLHQKFGDVPLTLDCHCWGSKE